MSDARPEESRTRTAAADLGARPTALEAVDLCRSFRLGDGSELRVLEGVNVGVEHGEVVAVVGQSGTGKSTLLHVLGGLDRPTSGIVRVGGADLSGLGSGQMARVRNQHVGFVFQFHHLLREFTALENVAVPALIGGADPEEANERARRLLEAVGLAPRLNHKPWQLSGGEQQRVAVARALANHPTVLLADEPSGNLDRRTSDELHDLLFELREERELTMVLVTHNLELADRADRILHLADGVLRPSDDA